MRLEDILHAVPRLNAVERQQLREYLDCLPQKSPRLSPEERMRRLNAAFDELGAGLSPAELNGMTAAMTGESSKPAENNWIFRARKYPPDHPYLCRLGAALCDATDRYFGYNETNSRKVMMR